MLLLLWFFVHPKSIKLANLTIITKMTIFPCHSKRHVLMKFIEIPLYGLVKISNVFTTQIFCYALT